MEASYGSDVLHLSKSVFGTYYKRRLLNLQNIDDHIAKMLNDGCLNSDRTRRGSQRPAAIREARYNYSFIQEEVTGRAS